MDLYIFIDTVVSVLYLSLVFVSLTNKGYKRSINRLFAYLSFCLLVWLIANHISNDTSNPPEMVVYVNYALFAASFLTALLVTKLTVMITNNRRVSAVYQRIEPFLWLIAFVSATPLVGQGVENQGSVYGVIFGPGVSVYAIGLMSMLLIMAIAIVKGWHISDKRRRNQVRTIGLGLSMAGPMILLLGFLIPYFTNNFEITQIAIAPLILLALAIFFSIIRHGLFNIKLAAVRTLAYIFSLGAVASVYYGLVYFVSILFFHGTMASGVGMSPINIVLALILAFIFQPIKLFFDKITDRIFFRNSYNTDELLSQLGEVLTSTTHLRTLLEKTTKKLQDTLKASYVVFAVYRNHKHSLLIGSGSFPRFTREEVDTMHELAKNLGDESLVIDDAIESLSDSPVSKSLLHMLERRHVALLTPLGDHVGYLLLGDALRGGYSQQDTRLLRAISDELVIAIENARSVQEVRELNAHLQQRIDHATQELRETNDKLRKLDETKDEFISMASHQLRTPLTSIKGYLSMVLEGDMGKINPAQQKVLSEAYSSSERMVRLIGDFLNVSRLQTGKFVIDSHPTDLTKLIDEEVDAMQRLAESHGMTLVYKRPRKFPILNVDADKLRQVIMNFIDNAIYYSRPNSTIVIKAYVEHDDAIVEVHDQGIGVPEAEQAQLFTKFFRAENARRQRPDGTGVGLFLARKVVTAQSGEVVFSSRQGKGSVFGFRLPIKKLAIKK